MLQTELDAYPLAPSYVQDKLRGGREMGLKVEKSLMKNVQKIEG